MEDTNTESLECTDFYEQAYNVLQNIENSLTEITKEKPGLRYEETVSIALFKNKSCIIELGNRCKQTTMYKSVGYVGEQMHANTSDVEIFTIMVRKISSSTAQVFAVGAVVLMAPILADKLEKRTE